MGFNFGDSQCTCRNFLSVVDPSQIGANFPWVLTIETLKSVLDPWGSTDAP